MADEQTLPETQQSVHVETYEQQVFNAMRAARPEETANAQESEAGTETQQESDTAQSTQGAQEGAAGSQADAVVQKSEDRLSRLERLMEADRERLQQTRARAEQEARLSEFERFQKDPVAYLDQKNPDLLERWLQNRYQKVTGKAPATEAAQAAEGDAVIKDLKAKYDELHGRVQQSQQERIVQEYRTGVVSAMSRASESELSMARDYCQAQGSTIEQEAIAYAATIGERTGKVPTEQESLDAVMKYIASDLDTKAQLHAKYRKPASEPAPVRGAGTLHSGLKQSARGAVTPKEDNYVPKDLDDYTNNTLQAWRNRRRS